MRCVECGAELNDAGEPLAGLAASGAQPVDLEAVDTLISRAMYGESLNDVRKKVRDYLAAVAAPAVAQAELSEERPKEDSRDAFWRNSL